jgi:hypothetical protein
MKGCARSARPKPNRNLNSNPTPFQRYDALFEQISTHEGDVLAAITAKVETIVNRDSVSMARHGDTVLVKHEGRLAEARVERFVFGVATVSMLLLEACLEENPFFLTLMMSRTVADRMVQRRQALIMHSVTHFDGVTQPHHHRPHDAGTADLLLWNKVELTRSLYEEGFDTAHTRPMFTRGGVRSLRVFFLRVVFESSVIGNRFDARDACG